MPISKQTPTGSFFVYNPFAGAQIHVFESGAHSVHILHPVPPIHNECGDTSAREAEAANGAIRVSHVNGCERAFLHGREISAYSIVYPGKRRKKAFAKY